MKKTLKTELKNGDKESIELNLVKDGNKFIVFDNKDLQSAKYIGIGESKREAVYDYTYKNKNMIYLLHSQSILSLFNLKSIFT